MKIRTLQKLERDIEAAFMRKAKKAYPWLRILKFSAISQRSWPDRLIPLPNGKVLHVEFKRPGEVPTPLQKDIHEYLRGIGHDVQVFDDADKAFAYLQGKLK